MNHMINSFRFFCLIFIIPIATNINAGNLSSWKYVKDIDILTDKDSSYAYIQASNCNLHSCGMLKVRADGSVIVHFDKFMESENDIQIKYRFDKFPNESMDLSVSTTGISGFVKNNYKDKFVAKLMYYNSLIIRGYDYNGTPTTLNFPLTRSSENILKVSAFRNAKTFEQYKETERIEDKIKSFSPKELSIVVLKALESTLDILEKENGKNSNSYQAILSEYLEKKAAFDLLYKK